MKKVVLSLIIALGLFGFSTESIIAQKIADEAKLEKAKISREVRKEILSLPYYGVFDAISYKIDGGTVILKGYVTRPLTKDEAEMSVRDVSGVTNVVNDIEVLPLSSTDDRIRVRIYREIANKGAMYRYLLGANPSIRIIVKNGRVMLEGIVANEADKTLAGISAREIFGVFSVDNNLQVEKREGERVG